MLVAFIIYTAWIIKPYTAANQSALELYRLLKLTPSVH